jgi:hypothetical protein
LPYHAADTTDYTDASLPSHTDHLAVLANAISDVGYWSWWARERPDMFQLKFGGTQLYFPPQAKR